MATSSPFARDAYEIRSPRLIIRTPILSDAEDMRAFITNPDNNPHTPSQLDATIESMRMRVGKWQEATAKGTNGFQVVTLASTSEVIGYGGFNGFYLIEETASPRYLTDFGVMIAKSHWRRGYGLEVVCALAEYAFVELRIAQIKIETELANEPWRSLMHSMGLAGFETQQCVSYDEHTVGYVWQFDAANWQALKEGLQKKGKWPL
jgi:RimJ/RimL family protein N-acetyltransferase